MVSALYIEQGHHNARYPILKEFQADLISMYIILSIMQGLKHTYLNIFIFTSPS